MAVKILALQKLMLSSLRMGLPLCAVPALRWSSDYSVLTNRNISETNIKKWNRRESITIPTVMSKRSLHPVYNDTLTKFQKHTEDAFSASDSDGETERAEDGENDVGALLDSTVKLSDGEWSNLIEGLSRDERYARYPSVDGMIVKQCLRQNNYRLGTSFIEYLASQGKEPNLLALASYLQLCGQCVQECGEERVLDVYKELCSRVKAFDVTLSEHAILALTKTSKWKLAFKHLKVIKKLCNVNSQVYSALIAACFNNVEYDTGWHLLDTMVKEEKEPHDNAYFGWLKQCESGEDVESMASLLFRKFADHDLYPNVPVINEIKRLYEEKHGWSGMYMKVFTNGECPACGHHLENLEMKRENFDRLRDEFADRILYGTDIFKATSPQEWTSFVDFVEKEGPFTTVVDGLNVAYTVGKKPPHVRMRRVREAVQKLKVANRKGRIMVIGRKHMIDWSPRDLEAIERRAAVFTLDNISKDDGFMLYAALRSGLGTHFLTSDMLRDHIHRLGDPTLKETFRQWQRGHQILAVATLEGVKLVPPPSFRTSAQKQGTEGWHIPYNDGSSREAYQVPYTWLCLQSKPHQQERLSTSRSVSRDPFESSPENSSASYLNNPRHFGSDPNSPEADFIVLTGRLLGSEKSEPKPLDIPYGRFGAKPRDLRDDRAHPRSSYSQFESHSKSSSAKSKMREDMMRLVGSDKGRQRRSSVISDRSTTKDRFEPREISNKREFKSNKKITFKDIFSDPKSES